MADSSDLLLEPIGTDDFVELAESCGLEMSRDVLDQLERRKLLVPASLDGSDAWTLAHLYQVALYFDSVTQIRHPWTSISGGLTVKEVSKRARNLAKLIERAAEDPSSVAEDATELSDNVGEFAATRNPLGGLADVLDLSSRRTRELLSGAGRLFAELQRIQRAAASLADASAGVEATPPPASSAKPTAETTSGATDTKSEGSSTEKTERGTTTSERPSRAADTVKTKQASRSDATDSTSAKPATNPSTPEPESTASPAEQSEASEAVDDSEASDDEDENVFAFNDATEVMDEDELSSMSDAARDAAEETDGDEENGFAREGSNVTSRTRDLRSRLDNLRHEDKKVARKRGKDVEPGDDGDDERDEDEGRSDEMAERIAELNKLREKYLAAQQWEKLTDLYEDGISLFVDPQERQKVYLTLAMLYEVKLGELGKALERFIDAYMEEDGGAESRAKALDGVRRVGRQKANRSRLVEWLEEAVSEVDEPARRAELQREYALALDLSGEGQRAFYTYSSYLADAPRDQITSDVLDNLEQLGAGLDGQELTDVYRDLLGSDLSDDVYADVAMRAARHAADEGDNETAVELYEDLLDAQPEHEVAFHSLAHLYEDTERWLELFQLYEERVAQKGGDAGPALTSELERTEEQLLDHADQITYRLEAAYVSGDEDIVDQFSELYIKHERYAEGYAFLNKFVEDADDEGARARAYIALARIAVRHLHTPEEAALHYERALELAGPDAQVLQDLARVRFDSGDWTDALIAVKALIGQVDDELDDAQRVNWLSMGVRAARKADRSDDEDDLLDQLREIDPEHELLDAT